MKNFLYFFVFLLGMAGSGCTDGECSDESERCSNPASNDSELTLLMRGMFEDAERIKAELSEDREVVFHVDHTGILSAESSDMEKTNSAEFQSYAALYLQAKEEMTHSPTSDRAEAFDAWIQTCTNCHESLCPGPLVRIKKLY